jgi:hypothetical protein
MTDYVADAASSSVGTTLTVRTGTASADTVPAGAYVVWQNTGAGTHIVTLTNSFTTDTGAAPNRTISIPAGGFKAGRVPTGWGDTNGRVAVGIDGTASEVKFMIPGNI